MKGMGDLFWYLGCAFKHDKMKDVVKMTQTMFIDSLVEPFHIQYGPRLFATVEFNLGPKKRNEKEGDWLYKQMVGDLLWI